MKFQATGGGVSSARNGTVKITLLAPFSQKDAALKMHDLQDRLIEVRIYPAGEDES